MMSATVCQPLPGAAPLSACRPGDVWHEAGAVHIDVRGLLPPEPLVRILELVEQAQAGDVIIVHHDREPRLLFPELVERGWGWTQEPAPSGEFRLALRREA